MIPICDLKIQYSNIKNEVMEAVEAALDSCQFILGNEVKRFEEECQKYIGAKYAVGVGNGTDAILLALKVHGIKAGDAVITSSFTYFATAGAIARCGATPVFCDINPGTFNIDPEKIEKILEDKTISSKIKAIVPVHLYGQPADMDEIKSIANRYGVNVIEDAAQAFGAEYKGKKAGALADAGCFSFYPGKNLGTYGDGGMVLVNDEATAELLRVYRNQGNKIKYIHSVVGHNSRLDTVQAAILRVKLKYIDEWNQKRRAIAKFYDERIQRLGVCTPFSAKDSVHIYHLYVVRFKSGNEKNKVQKALSERGIDARTYYPIPLHLQECFKYLGYKEGDMPEAEKASVESLAIPMYPELSKGQQEFIVDAIKKTV